MDSNSGDSTRIWAGRYGLASPGVWKVALDAYYWDKVEHAHALATELGVGAGWQEWWYRLIEAESVTRQQSETRDLANGLKLELVDSEIEHPDRISADVEAACASVRSRFGWQETADTLISVLAQETDAPWTANRAGYMMDKYPYDKICIPNGVTAHSPYLQSVIRHEFAHVMVLNLSQGQASIYLHEAVTMVAQNLVSGHDWMALAEGRAEWLDPNHLSTAFDDQHDPQRYRKRSMAYAQSAAIGFYLRSMGGETKIGDLLREFAKSTPWNQLKRTVTGQSAADRALKQVYGLREQEVFDLAHNWMRENGPRPAQA